MDPLILPRLQFAFAIGHHIRRPAFAIGVVPRILSRLPLSRLSQLPPSAARAEEKDVPPRPWRLRARVGPALIPAAALAACTTATPRLSPPAPATLAAVHGLTRAPATRPRRACSTGFFRSHATALTDENWLLPRTVALLGILDAA